MNLLKLINTKTQPQVYYGLHMVPGLAEYNEPEKESLRIYIGESACKQMDPTFRGKPLYVEHVDDVDPKDLEKETELDGVVVRSFFNPHDGMHWAEFVVFTDRGKQRIKEGWQLSNAYVPSGFAGGGENHGVQYSKEVTSGEYEHLAIVQNPRYEESVILTPEEFKEYNAAKEAELMRLANSKETQKEKGEMAFKLNIFKRTKVENGKDGIDLTGLMVELPESKQEMLLTEVVEKFDKIQNMQGYANGDHMVKVGDDEMSVNDLVKKHVEMCNAEKERAEKEMNADEEVEEAEADVGDRGGDDSLDNEEDDAAEESVDNAEESEEAPKADDKKKNSKTDDAAKAAAKAKNAALKNARPRETEEVARVETMADRVARGKARYGSN